MNFLVVAVGKKQQHNNIRHLLSIVAWKSVVPLMVYNLSGDDTGLAIKVRLPQGNTCSEWRQPWRIKQSLPINKQACGLYLTREMPPSRRRGGSGRRSWQTSGRKPSHSPRRIYCGSQTSQQPCASNHLQAKTPLWQSVYAVSKAGRHTFVAHQHCQRGVLLTEGLGSNAIPIFQVSKAIRIRNIVAEHDRLGGV